MEYGQPPSWRPDVEQFRVEAYRGTVRDALGGLRNLEQLLGSLRVGPRALFSLLPDVRSSCPALVAAIDGLVALIGGNRAAAEGVATGLRQVTHSRLDSLAEVIGTIEQQTLNAKNRLRLEEAVSNTARDLEAVVDLVDMLGEVVWGRAMSLDLCEVAREAFRTSEPPNLPQPAVHLAVVSRSTSAEYAASPRALLFILHHLVRWAADRMPQVTPVFSIDFGDSTELETGTGLIAKGLPGEVRVHIRPPEPGVNTEVTELRWAPGRRQLPVSEDALRFAIAALHLGLDLDQQAGRVTLVFPPSSAQVT